MAKGTKTGGRSKGTPNKITAEIRSLALVEGPTAFAHLVKLSTSAESEAVRLAACREILDRAYGKPQQSIAVADDRENRPHYEYSDAELYAIIREGEAKREHSDPELH